MLLPVLMGCVALGLAQASSASAPDIRRESIEWCNIWVPDATTAGVPRVLLIGDSISMGYYEGVQRRLSGKALVARLSTSAAVGDPALLQQVRMLLGQYRFEVIHLNVGLHGSDYTEADYRAHLPGLLAAVRRAGHGARLVWGSTTPWRKPAPDTAALHANNPRVVERNRIAAELMAARNIPVNDLYGAVIASADLWSADGVHLKPAGSDILAERVAAEIARVLAAK